MNVGVTLGASMPLPEIIGSARSSYTRVVRMVCEEKGIEYLLTERPLRAPEVLAIHPFGKMPVLRHGDFTLCESKAIATYLDRSFPGIQLIPSDPRLAGLTEQWVSLVNTVIDGTLIRTYLLAYAAPKTADGKPDRKTIDAVMPALHEQFGILDQAVAKTGYLVDDQFTLADINLLPILHYVRMVPEGAQALAAAKHLDAYYGRHAARPSFQRTIPPPGPPPRS
jgi:glutathione S-transferase